VDSMAWPKGLTVEVGGHGVVSHAGSALTRLIADRTGLTGALSGALARRGFTPLHDRGRVLADLAVAIADGATTISEIDTLRHQGELFGPVASDTTAWRTLAGCDSAALARIGRARARSRRHVWGLIAGRHGGIPPARAAGRDLGDVIVIRLDATIVIAHSDKQLAKGTHKGTYGHHPLTAWCDNTAESLAVMLRPGNAGSNTAADHISAMDTAIAQVPAKYRRKVLFTCDGAGASHAFVDHVTRLNARPGYQVHYSAGFDFDERIRDVLPRLPETAWTPAIDADGVPRPDAQVAELTGLLRHSTGGDRLAGWPPDMRILIRRENPHPGAQLSLFEQHEGKRYQVTATSTPGGQVQFLEARHRTQARVEDRIRCGKSTGLGHLPSRDYKVNTAWCQAASIACDLLAWLRLLALDGDLARAEPKTLRYRILHTAGRIVKGQRRRYLRIPPSWPWAHAIASAFTRILALPPA
jgi:Transposase DDE domain group 1